MNRSVTNVFRLQLLAVVGVLSMAVAGSAVAQDNEDPFKRGAYWSVTGIHVNDGSGLKYANHLAKSWMRNQEFAKSKGWISGYHVLSNAYPRKGEPNVYLVTIFNEMTSAADDDKRAKEWLEFNKSTMAQMDAESGERASYRTVGSEVLLTEMLKR
jgi:hypothetical protein